METKNTRFCHAFTSGRAAKNTVHSLHSGNSQITDEVEIRSLFLEHMKGLLGVETQVIPVHISHLYTASEMVNLDHLQAPFSEMEVKAVVFSFAANKSSGAPDGLPNEFLQCY